MNSALNSALLVALTLVVPVRSLAAQPAVDAPRARLIILADMGNEPDEEQQMAHMLMCCNAFDLDALIAVTGKYLRPESKIEYRRSLHPEPCWKQPAACKVADPSWQIRPQPPNDSETQATSSFSPFRSGRETSSNSPMMPKNEGSRWR